MAAYVARRLVWAVFVVLFTMLVTFALMRGMGGTPFWTTDDRTGPGFALEIRLRLFYRMDEPWFVEYANYVKNVFTFHFGPSLRDRYLTVDSIVEGRFPVTLQLAGLASVWAIVLGIPLGLIAALRRSSAMDYVASSVATGLLVVPVFLFTEFFAGYVVYRWGVLSPGWESWKTRLLASFTLSLAPAGYIARLVRAAVVETLLEDYVRVAKAKGLRPRRIVVAHLLRNSLTPFLSAVAPTLALLVTGAFFVERAFAIPGAAQQYIASAEQRDYPMLMGLTVAVTFVVVVVNLVADVVAALLDPRLREARR